MANEENYGGSSNPPKGGAAPLVISLLALVISIGTAVYTVFFNPFGRALYWYNFDTPEDALRSEFTIEKRHDTRAMNEFRSAILGEAHAEKLDTLEIEKSSEFEWKSRLDRFRPPSGAEDDKFEKTAAAVFYSYKQKGKRQYLVSYFRKHKKSGLWVRNPGGSLVVDDKLQKEINEWRDRDREKKEVKTRAGKQDFRKS